MALCIAYNCICVSLHAVTSWSHFAIYTISIGAHVDGVASVGPVLEDN